MSLKPWLPVPITPSVTRLLGATLPPKPKRRAGDDRGKGQAGGDPARAVMSRNHGGNVGRGLDGCWLMRGRSRSRGLG